MDNMDAGYAGDRRKRPDRQLYQPGRAVGNQRDNSGTNQKANGVKQRDPNYGGQGYKNTKPRTYKGHNDQRNAEGWDERSYGGETFNNEWQQYDQYGSGPAFDGSGGRGDYDYRQQNKRQQQQRYFPERGRGGGHQEPRGDRRFPANYGNRPPIPHRDDGNHEKDGDGFPEVGYFSAETEKKKKNEKERSRKKSEQSNSVDEIGNWNSNTPKVSEEWERPRQHPDQNNSSPNVDETGWDSNAAKATEEWPGSAESFDKPEGKSIRIPNPENPESANDSKAQKIPNRKEREERKFSKAKAQEGSKIKDKKNQLKITINKVSDKNTNFGRGKNHRHNYNQEVNDKEEKSENDDEDEDDDEDKVRNKDLQK